MLVLVTGPIASGKTSTPLALAQRRRGAGQKAASVDMDDIMTMVAGSDWTLTTAEQWDTAGGVAAAIIDRLCESGTQFLFISGPFFSNRNRRVVLDSLHVDPNVRCVVLQVELEETIRRAANDGRRTMTKDPDLIKNVYATIDWEALPPDAIRIYANALDASAVVDEVEMVLNLD
jgi:hypothetical protein